MSDHAAPRAGRRAPCGVTTGEFLALPVPAQHAVPIVDPASERVRRIWTGGDGERIAAGLRREAELFVDRRHLRPGLLVLDAACGTGNAAIPAARTGAAVVAIDFVAHALQVTAERAGREALAVRVDLGSVESLPYADASFDAVLSFFGVMYAARPHLVLDELTRITRPGGSVAIASWTAGGVVGDLHALLAAMVPPPLDLPDPLRWGDAEIVSEWFDDHAWVVSTERRWLRLGYPFTPGGTTELFRTADGPTVRAFESLEEDGRAELAARIEQHWARHRRPASPGTEVDSEYLEVIAVRR